MQVQSKIDYVKELKEKIPKLLYVLEDSHIQVDKEKFLKIQLDVNKEYDEYYLKIKDYIGDVNLNSSNELGRKLLEKLNIELPKTKTGRFSINTETLQGIDHEIGSFISQAKSLKKGIIDIKTFQSFISLDWKVNSTYVYKIRSGIAGYYPEKPSLMNTPKVIRPSIIPSQGKLFVSVYYYHPELLMAARMSKQTDIEEVYDSQESIVNWMRELFNSIGELVFDDTQTVKFLRDLMRGSEGNTLSQELGIELDLANSYVKAFWNTFGKIKELRDTVHAFGLQTGTSFAYSGHVFEIDEFRIDEEKGKRQAFNVSIATSVNECLLQGLINTIPKLKETEKVVFLFRESVMFEIPKETPLDDFVNRISDSIKSPVQFPLVIETGLDWGEILSSLQFS